MPVPPKETRMRLARAGEEAAAQELTRIGYRILARNFRCRGGEADLVAAENDAIVFVEVKTRASLTHGLPREAVGWSKQQRLARAAEHYLQAENLEDSVVRFDIVEVVIVKNRIAAVELIRDAFIPET